MDKLSDKMTTKGVVKRNKQKTTSLPINQPENKKQLLTPGFEEIYSNACLILIGRRMKVVCDTRYLS